MNMYIYIYIYRIHVYTASAQRFAFEPQDVMQLLFQLLFDLYTYIHTYMHTRVSMCQYTYPHMHIRIPWTYVYTYLFKHIYIECGDCLSAARVGIALSEALVYIHIRTYIRAIYINTHIHIWTYTYTHIHVYTYMHSECGDRLWAARVDAAPHFHTTPPSRSAPQPLSPTPTLHHTNKSLNPHGRRHAKCFRVTFRGGGRGGGGRDSGKSCSHTAVG